MAMIQPLYGVEPQPLYGVESPEDIVKNLAVYAVLILVPIILIIGALVIFKRKKKNKR